MTMIPSRACPGKSDNSGGKGPCWGCTNTNNSEMCRTFLNLLKRVRFMAYFPQWTMNTLIILSFRATVAIISHEKSFPPPAASNLKTSGQPRHFAFSRARILITQSILNCRPLSVQCPHYSSHMPKMYKRQIQAPVWVHQTSSIQTHWIK